MGRDGHAAARGSRCAAERALQNCWRHCAADRALEHDVGSRIARPAAASLDTFAIRMVECLSERARACGLKGCNCCAVSAADRSNWELGVLNLETLERQEPPPGGR
jgi:hypothetical protein